jgi:hypothetical protein
MVWPLLSIPTALGSIVCIAITIYNVYSVRQLPYPLLLFLPFPLATVLSWTHIVSQMEAAMITIAANGPGNQAPRRLNWARITNWSVALYAAYQLLSQFILLGLLTRQIIKLLDASDGISAQLLLWASTWVEGSPLPLSELLSLKPLLDTVSSAFGQYRVLGTAFASILFSHVYLTILILLPATYIQVRDIRRQIADLRSVRRDMDGSAQRTCNPFKGLSGALFVRYADDQIQSVASVGSSNAKARLVLLEKVCLNM